MLLSILLATASLYGAADRQPAPASAPQKISRDWKRVTSGDLEVVGNASEKDLRRALVEVQRFQGTLLALVPGLRTASPQRIMLVVLRDVESFQRFVPRDGRGRKQENVGGYFSVQPYANVMVLPMFAEREITFQTAFHEYTHYLTYRNMRNLPGWLNEGLAELYSTFFVNGEGKSVIGLAPPGRIAALQSRPLWPLSRFLDPETAARLFENESDTALFYAQAWAFVHFMTLGDKGSRQGQILQYLQTLQKAPSQADAARQAFGSDLNQLDVELRRYVKQFQLPAIVLNVREIAAAPATIEPMAESDALHLQGRLLADLGVADEAEALLTKALAIDGQHAGARVGLGRVRVRQERHAEAVDLLTAIAGQHPGDFEAQFYLGSALGSADRYEDSLKAYARAITLKSDSPAAWFGLSVAAMALARDSQSDAAMRQVQRHYSEPSWYYTRAQSALGLGRNEVAARDAREFLNRAGWGEASAPYAAFIGAIAHWRLNQPAEAEALLADAARAARAKSWVATVVQYLQNQLPDDGFLARAKDNGQRTEAHAYIGVRALLAGRADEARKHFLWVRDRGDRNYTEYALALAELKRLENRPANTPSGPGGSR